VRINRINIEENKIDIETLKEISVVNGTLHIGDNIFENVDRIALKKINKKENAIILLFKDSSLDTVYHFRDDISAIK